MSRFLFFLSGEHPTLPASEVKGAIEGEDEDFGVLEKSDQVLVLETDCSENVLSRRLGLCHWIGEHFCTSSLDDLFETVSNSDLVDFLPQSESLSVRVKRVREYFEDVDTQELASEMGELLVKEYGYEIDLEYPDNEIIIVLSEDSVFVSLLKRRVEREGFSERKPPERSSVHPSTMQPELARAMVNLSRVSDGDDFLDPFCGVGGILIEAGLVGTKPVGVDIDSELLEGARDNLEEIGIRDFELVEGDARDLDLGRFDAVATDPPYGRQASTGGEELEELYRDALPEILDVLKVGGFLCVSAPDKLDLRDVVEDLALDLVEKHGQKVHRSLSRNIYVYRKRVEV